MDETVFKKYPEIETERLFLRQVQLDDIQIYHQMRTDSQVMQYMDVPKPNSIEVTQQKINDEIESFTKKESVYWTLILKSAKEFIGVGGFWRLIKPHYRAELGYQILPEFWRQGFAEEACRVIINFGFNHLKLHSIEANVNPANLPSIKLLEKLGFVREAYFKENFYFDGKFVDTAIYSLLVSKWDNIKS